MSTSALANIQSVSTVPAATDNDGLLLEGFAATWDRDRVSAPLIRIRSTVPCASSWRPTPVLLFSHKYSLPPCGRIIEAEIRRDKGLWVKALLPKPAPGTLASEIYDAAKNGILRAFSVGGRWLKQDNGTHGVIFDADLCEISLCPVAVNGAAFATSVTPTSVKCIGGGYLTPTDYAAGLATAREQLALADPRMTLAAELQRTRA